MNEFGDGFWIGFASAWLGVCLIEIFARWWKKVGDRRRAGEAVKAALERLSS